jgi:peptidoglycan/LPS O-acetylase OafA/YrhL
VLPVAQVTHFSPGRLRLRVSARRGQDAFFQRATEVFAQIPTVERIEANPVTGSILLVPGVDPAALGAHAERAGLLRITLEAVGGSPLTEQLAAGFQGVNRGLRRMTGGALDLASVGVVGLLAAAVVQWNRGHVLGPAATLLWYAVGLLLMTDVARAAKAKTS